MVEIFKGKDSDGVWHEGFYCVFNDEAHRIYTGYAETDCGEYYPDYYTVIPQTVRRCAGGITDKNGKVLEETPTADVVEVVKCKDCKHFDKNKGYRDTKFSFSFCDKFHHNITTENDFCSYGERIDMNDL